MDKPTIKIEVWSDFRCPFCYIAEAMLDKLAREMADRAEIAPVHRSYELYPDAPKHTENTILDSYSRKYGLTKAEAEEKISAISEYGRKVGIVNFNYGGAVPTETFDAHRLCKYGEENGHGEIYDKLMYAFFCDNVDLADTGVLLDIAADCGMNRDDTARMLRSDRYAQAVRDDERHAADLGIHSVPCFYLNGEKFLGTGCFAELKARLQALTPA